MKDRDIVKTITNICHKLKESMQAASDLRMVMIDGGIGEHPYQTFTQPNPRTRLLTKTRQKILGWRAGRKCSKEQTPTTMTCTPRAENDSN
jgi:hypothetical protein